jgi:hypothetical protein
MPPSFNLLNSFVSYLPSEVFYNQNHGPNSRRNGCLEHKAYMYKIYWERIARRIFLWGGGTFCWGIVNIYIQYISQKHQYQMFISGIIIKTYLRIWKYLACYILTRDLDLHSYSPATVQSWPHLGIPVLTHSLVQALPALSCEWKNYQPPPPPHPLIPSFRADICSHAISVTWFIEVSALQYILLVWTIIILIITLIENINICQWFMRRNAYILWFF